MRLDDAAADGLEIRHPGVAGKMVARPGAAPVLDRPASPRRGCASSRTCRPGATAPVVCRHHRTSPSTSAASVLTCAPVSSVHQKCPAVQRRRDRSSASGIAQAAGAHAAQVDHRLGEHRETRRHHAVRRGLQALRQRHRQLVVDPPVRRIQRPGVPVLGRNDHVVRARDILEELHPPRIASDRSASRQAPARSACSSFSLRRSDHSAGRDLHREQRQVFVELGGTARARDDRGHHRMRQRELQRRRRQRNVMRLADSVDLAAPDRRSRAERRHSSRCPARPGCRSSAGRR